MRSSLLSIFFRGSTLFSRLLQTVILAKWLPLEDIGTFGLLTATIAFSIAFLGLDFFYYSGRELLKSSDSMKPVMLRDQMVFHMIVSTISLPCFIGVFALGKFDWSLIYLFYAILVTEHLGQEGYRLLIMLKDPVAANICYFIRLGAWVIPTIILMHFNWIDKSLTSVLIGWLCGSTLSILYLIKVFSKWEWHLIKQISINWTWIKKGIPFVIIYIFTTQALRATSLIDRYFLDEFCGRELVAIYVFYSGITAALVAFLDAGLVSQENPYIIESVAEGKSEEAIGRSMKLFYKVIAFALVLAGLAHLFINHLLEWIDRAIYSDYLHVFNWVMLAAVLNVVASVPNTLLYALKKDKVISAVSIIGVVVMLVAALLLIEDYGIIGAVMSLIVYAIYNLTVRCYLVKKYF